MSRIHLYNYHSFSCFFRNEFSCPSQRLTSYRLSSSHVSRLTSHALPQKAIMIAFHLPKRYHGVAITWLDAGRETRDVSERHGTAGHETQEIA